MEVEVNLSTLQHKICGYYCATICLFGLFLNGYLLYLIFKRKNRRNLLNINLTIANFLMCLTYPFNFLSHFNEKWAFSQPLCNIYGFLCLLFGFVHLMSIAMICVDEYLQVFSKQTNKQRLQRTQWMSIFTWFNSTFWSVAPIYGWSRIALEPTKTSCGVAFKLNDGYESYITSVFMCCYLVPALFLIYAKLKFGSARSEKAPLLSTKALMLFGVFLICWSPYSMLYLWPIIAKTGLNLMAHAWAPLIAKTANVILPLILINMDYSRQQQSPRKVQ